MMIDEDYFVFYEGEDPIIECPYFCKTKKEAEFQYAKWAKEYPEDTDSLHIAKIIKKPKQMEATA